PTHRHSTTTTHRTLTLHPAPPPEPDPLPLLPLFPPANDVPSIDYVSATAVPQPYHKLLVHKRHMTVTQEAYHGDKMDVRILERRRIGDFYARKILLALHTCGKFAQFGIARINLRYCTQAVS